MDLAGGTAVVTGGGSGIGRGLAMTWAAEGMNVVVADIDRATADRVADDARGLGVGAIGLACDVSDEAAVQELAARSYAEFGRVDVLCNNAGVGIMHKPLAECTPAEWRWIFDVNLFG